MLGSSRHCLRRAATHFCSQPHLSLRWPRSRGGGSIDHRQQQQQPLFYASATKHAGLDAMLQRVREEWQSPKHFLALSVCHDTMQSQSCRSSFFVITHGRTPCKLALISKHFQVGEPLLYRLLLLLPRTLL